MMKRSFVCPGCGAQVKFPVAWILGVEVVFACGGCGKRFKTGYKMGALLMGLSLAVSLGIANLAVWLFSSVSMPLFVVAAIPLWVLLGFYSRSLYFRQRWSGKKAKPKP